MSTPTNPQREQPSTYVVQDRSNQNEFMRIRIQDQMLTASMGGVLPEQLNPATFRYVLDVGCGTGCWLLEAAGAHPTMSRLVGVDISGRMIEYARTQAEEQQVSDRVEFHVADALRLFEFPSNSFDLVNMRLGSSFLRKWDWPKILDEFERLVRPGGLVRLTESDMITESSSAAMLRFNQVVFQALHQAGHFFEPESHGVTSELAHLLQHQGFEDVQTQAYKLEYHSGTPQGDLYYEDTKSATQTLLPFLRKWTHVPEDYEALCQQVLSDMSQPNFVAIWRFLTVWGKKRQLSIGDVGI